LFVNALLSYGCVYMLVKDSVPYQWVLFHCLFRGRYTVTTLKAQYYSFDICSVLNNKFIWLTVKYICCLSLLPTVPESLIHFTLLGVRILTFAPKLSQKVKAVNGYEDKHLERAKIKI
jgi:hypothetical protein